MLNIYSLYNLIKDYKKNILYLMHKLQLNNALKKNFFTLINWLKS